MNWKAQEILYHHMESSKVQQGAYGTGLKEIISTCEIVANSTVGWPQELAKPELVNPGRSRQVRLEATSCETDLASNLGR